MSCDKVLFQSNQVPETASCVLFKCCFTIQIWSKVKNWLGLSDVDTSGWHAMRSVKEWWIEGVQKHEQSKKAMASLAMLISWEIWKERNSRFFRNEASTSNMSNVMPRG
jgi:hypothetical protein